MVNISNLMLNHDYSIVRKSYQKACGNSKNEKNKKWIVDIDEIISESELLKLTTFINSLQPEGPKILADIPSKNGRHLISSPFNLQKFRINYPTLYIQKDNPTNLYIP